MNCALLRVYNALVHVQVPAVTPTVLPADPLDVQSLVVCIVFGIAFFVVGFIAIIIFFILLK